MRAVRILLAMMRRFDMSNWEGKKIFLYKSELSQTAQYKLQN